MEDLGVPLSLEPDPELGIPLTEYFPFRQTTPFWYDQASDMIVVGCNAALSGRNRHPGKYSRKVLFENGNSRTTRVSCTKRKTLFHISAKTESLISQIKDYRVSNRNLGMLQSCDILVIRRLECEFYGALSRLPDHAFDPGPLVEEMASRAPRWRRPVIQ
jgi:hypothetical protein